MSEPVEKPKGRWCLVGNVVEERRYGEGGEIRRGTRLFAPGAKVYCLPAVFTRYGGDRLFAIGRHRKSGRFIGTVIRPEWVVERRAQVVYHPEVLRRIEEELGAGSRGMRDPWPDQSAVEAYINAEDPCQTTRRPMSPPLVVPAAPARRIATAVYDQLMARGAIAADAPLELSGGILVWRPSRPPFLAECVERVRRALSAAIPENYHVRVDAPIWAADYDAPRPTLAVVRGPADLYAGSFPSPSVIRLVVEVAPEREDVGVYARAGIPYCWIVDVGGRSVEQHGGPDGEVYRRGETVLQGATVPLYLDGSSVGPIAVADLLP